MISVVALISGCATTAKYEAKVRSWEGQDVNTLTQVWGIPDDTQKLSNGNTLMLYARLKHPAYAYNDRVQPRRQIAAIGPIKPMTDVPGVYIKCATYFEVTPDHKITSVIYRGDECKSKD